jgi:hypothetical protein
MCHLLRHTCSVIFTESHLLFNTRSQSRLSHNIELLRARTWFRVWEAPSLIMSGGYLSLKNITAAIPISSSQCFKLFHECFFPYSSP